MLRWRSAEALLYDPEDDGPSCQPIQDPLNLGGRRIPHGDAAFFRHQPDLRDCPCAECDRRRWLAKHPDERPKPRPREEVIRIDRRGLRWVKV